MKYLLSIFIILFSTFFLLISYEKTKWGSNVIHEIVENRKKISTIANIQGKI